jgi:hypothetical protein
MNRRRIKRPSPAFVVALIALFVALGGTAGAVVTAAVPLAKRALVADNAKKLNGVTAPQLGAAAVQLALRESPAGARPASTAASLVTIKTAPFALAPGAQGDFSAACDAGQKAVGGGYDNPVGTAYSYDNRPTASGGSWSVYLLADESSAAAGNIYAVCLK